MPTVVGLVKKTSLIARTDACLPAGAWFHSHPLFAIIQVPYNNITNGTGKKCDDHNRRFGGRQKLVACFYYCPRDTFRAKKIDFSNRFFKHE